MAVVRCVHSSVDMCAARRTAEWCPSEPTCTYETRTTHRSTGIIAHVRVEKERVEGAHEQRCGELAAVAELEFDEWQRRLVERARALLELRPREHVLRDLHAVRAIELHGRARARVRLRAQRVLERVDERRHHAVVLDARGQVLHHTGVSALVRDARVRTRVPHVHALEVAHTRLVEALPRAQFCEQYSIYPCNYTE